MKRFFGTDGIRGIANQDLTCELALRVGRAAAAVLNAKKAKILVGKDPRISSDMLESALTAGLLSVGATALACGIIPTPAVSFLTQQEGADAGIMISASHNPIEHNGIKIFGKNGMKLSDDQEKAIESCIRSKKESTPRPTGTNVGRMFEVKNARQQYLNHLKSSFPFSLSGLHIVLDCAYGATSVIAPELFQSLGAKVTSTCAIPDGTKINLNCGTTHLDFIRKATLDAGGDVGIAFDGDGDRVILINQKGNIINGDGILAALAFHWKKTGKLRGPVVTTIMANFGLEEALQRENISVVRTPVGDRYVFEEMLRLNANLGGEQSGHVILLDHGATGDGCLTALQIFSVLAETRMTLNDLESLIRNLPQILVNVPVKDKTRFQRDTEIKKVIQGEEIRLKGRGRIVVRLSGTEPLVRVMAEGPDPKELKEAAGRVVKTIKKRLA